MSQRRPAMMLPEQFNADYSHFKKFDVQDGSNEKGTSMKLLLKDLQFCSDVQYGLEFVDILTNAVRRALTNNLQKEGWQNIYRLMLHDNDGPYISFVLFQETGDVVHDAAYAKVVNESFRKDGRLVLTKRNLRLAMGDLQGDKPIVAV